VIFAKKEIESVFKRIAGRNLEYFLRVKLLVEENESLSEVEGIKRYEKENKRKEQGEKTKHRLC